MISLLSILLMTNIPPLADALPNRQPQLAVHDGVVALAFASGQSIMIARSKDGGESFSQPSLVATLPGLMAGRHRGPRIAISGSAIVVSAIAASAAPVPGQHAHGAAPDGNLLLWRSTDAGKSWSTPVAINDSPGSAREGLHAMAADDHGTVAAVWLDLRSKGTRLYGAFSNDAGATWSKNIVVYESPERTICECCHPSLTATGSGEFAVMFRNVAAGSRDMYLVRLKDGRVVSKAEKLGMDTWTLNACPMDGGGLAANGSRVFSAWRRGRDIFLAEAGKTETKIGSGKDVALATAGGKNVAIWTRDGRIEFWNGDKVQPLMEAGMYPVLAALPNGHVLAVWEDGGEIKIRRLPLAR